MMERAWLVGIAVLLGNLSPAHAADLSGAGGGDVREAAHHLAITLRGPVAEVETTQLLTSADAEADEGIYTFQLAGGAAVTGLTVTVGGRSVTAQVIDAEAAVAPPPGSRVAKVRGAADLAVLRLIERRGDRSTFELRVYPLASGRNLQVKLRWVAPLAWRDGRLVLRIPDRGGAGNLAAERVTVQLQPAAPVQGWRELSAGGRTFTFKGSGARRVELSPAGRADLVIEAWPVWAASARTHLSFAAAPLIGDTGGIALHLAAPPPRGAGGTLAYERFVAVVDVSRSMGPGGLDAAEKLLRTLLYALPVTARLELVLFDRKVQRPLAGFRINDDKAKQAFADAVTSAPLDNGSDLGAALDAVHLLLDKDEPPSGRRIAPATLVVLISDGLLALDVDEQQAVRRIGERAVADADVLAIGLAPDGAPLPGVAGGPLTALAVRSGGRSIAMRHGEVDARLGGLVAELSRPPPLERLAVEAPAGTILEPLALPARVDAGEGAVVIGRYRGKAPTRLVVTAVAGGHPVRLQAAGKDAALAGRVRALGLAAIGRPDGDRDEADPAAKGDAWLKAARTIGVVTPWAAMVALDPADSLARDRMAMAARWHGAVFFRIAPPPERDGGEALPEFTEIEEPADPVDAATVRGGTLDRAIIGRLIETHVLPRAKICYDKALRSQRNLRGEATLLVELARGEVARSEVIQSSFTGGASLETCLAEAGWSIQVPHVAVGDDSDTIDVVRYPLRFRMRGTGGEVSRQDRDQVVVDPDDPLGNP